MECPYQLLDSGDGLKLERFGSVTVVRPSSLCIWHKALPASDWQCNATYVPKKGWEKHTSLPEEWILSGIEGAGALVLRLQDNGQIGMFPEHCSYLPDITAALSRYQETSRKPKVLNLFAYTGMATCAALAAQAEVTHVELSKKALDWAKQNIEINKLPLENLRFIREDAVTFVEREVRRKSHYDVIIADPPGFSRLEGSKSWTLEEVLPQLILSLSQLLSPQGSTLFLTCHEYALGGRVMGNLLRDALPHASLTLRYEDLLLKESSTRPREIPAGFLVEASVAR